MTTVHATAVVDPAAQLADGADVGPYAVIGPHVRIGRGTRVMAHAVIDGHTTLGEGNVVYPGACLGMPPQDKKFGGDASYLVVGDDNVIREYVTMHCGGKAGSRTVVGSRNYLMVGTHVGHDCTVGNEITIANNTPLGGHAVIEDKVMIGGNSAVHQFCRVGKLAMVGGVTKVSSDVPPFSICDGRPARLYGINVIGLRRAGYTASGLRDIKQAIRTLFASGLALSHAVERVRAEFGGNPDIQHLLAFVAASKRGIARAETED